MKSLLVLGSTGSIGTQTLDVVRAAAGKFLVRGLAAGSSWEVLLAQAREFQPAFVALSDRDAAARLAAELDPGITVFSGPDALEEIARACDYDTAVHGVVGARGLAPSVAVLERGKDLALANKESLVVAGRHLTELARRTGARILPVDSELCAIAQCLRGEDPGRVRTVHLTASGGPLRDVPLGDIAGTTPEIALRHPTWSMGPRITVGSATLMNKALEVIEVHHLFGLSPEQIHVVIHHQSVVHSMVEFVDGSVIAQLGPPDMRGPLHYCLHDPDRAPADLRGFDIGLFRTLTFAEPDPVRFPALALGYRCLVEGSDSGSVLNAADEVAVEAFLHRRIAFPDICHVNRKVLDQRPGLDADVSQLLEADSLARDLAGNQVAALARA